MLVLLLLVLLVLLLVLVVVLLLVLLLLVLLMVVVVLLVLLLLLTVMVEAGSLTTASGAFSLRSFAAIVEFSWGPLGPWQLALLGLMPVAPSGLKDGGSEPSRAALGALFGAPRGLLCPLGPPLGHSWAIMGPSCRLKRQLEAKNEKAKHIGSL